MANKLADKIADRILSHEVDLQRFSVSERSKAVRVLKGLQADLKKKLGAIDPARSDTAVVRQARLVKMLEQTDKTIKSAYLRVKKTHASDMRDLADISAGTAGSAINASLGASVVSTALTPGRLKAIVSNNLVEGAPSSDWWGRQAASTRDRFADQVRQGMLQGESVRDMSRRVEGVMDVSRREAEALVRTSAQTISNDARMEMYRQNEDVIKGVEALATLDTRTTPICQARDGYAWDLDGNPLEGTPEPFPGPPPWHWNCRSTLVPITKSFKELGVKSQKEIPKGVRASMTGDVPARTTYEGWLKRQPKATQLQALGPTKWEMWKNGGMSLREMVDQTGRPLTIAQLRDRMPEMRITIPDGAPLVDGTFGNSSNWSDQKKFDQRMKKWRNSLEKGKPVSILNNSVSINHKVKAPKGVGTIELEISGQAHLINQRTNKYGLPEDVKYRVTGITKTPTGFRVSFQPAGVKPATTRTPPAAPPPPAPPPRVAVEPDARMPPKQGDVQVLRAQHHSSLAKAVTLGDGMEGRRASVIGGKRYQKRELDDLLPKVADRYAVNGVDPRLLANDVSDASNLSYTPNKSQLHITTKNFDAERSQTGLGGTVGGDYRSATQEIRMGNMKNSHALGTLIHEVGHHWDYKFLGGPDGTKLHDLVDRAKARAIRAGLEKDFKEALVNSWNAGARATGFSAHGGKPITLEWLGKEMAKKRAADGPMYRYGYLDIARTQGVTPHKATHALDSLSTAKGRIRRMREDGTAVGNGSFTIRSYALVNDREWIAEAVRNKLERSSTKTLLEDYSRTTSKFIDMMTRGAMFKDSKVAFAAPAAAPATSPAPALVAKAARRKKTKAWETVWSAGTRRTSTGKEIMAERNTKTGRIRWFYTATGRTYTP